MKESAEVPVEATAKSVEASAEVAVRPGDAPVEDATQPVEGRKPFRASPRKVAANRKNSRKSTGPKTLKGKANSRRNALKHGLFAMDLPIGTLTKTEDPAEYEALLDQLRQHHKPVGIAEDLEVQRMCASWWRLRRSWRCENAEIISARFDISYLEQQVLAKDEALLEELQRALDELEASGDIPAELAEKIFEHEYVGELWETIAAIARGEYGETTAKEPEQELDCDELRRAIELAILSLKRKPKDLLNVEYDLRAIPKPETQKRILRSEAAAERSLHRCSERLERLQRRRGDEPFHVSSA